MSDIEPKTPTKQGSSGAAWSDAEKIAYLVMLCDNEGKIDSKIANAPIPQGRTVISCKKLLIRLKKKHTDDIQKIKSGQPLAAATPGSGNGEGATSRKRKDKADNVSNVNGDGDGSPKKKGRGRKKAPQVVKEELGDEMVD